MIYYARTISENPYTGAHRWELSPSAERAVAAFLATKGETLDGTARAFRRSANGAARFTTGVGYAIFDADLLGGDGSGAREREFYDWGAAVHIWDGDRRRAEDRRLWLEGRREWRDDHAADAAEYRSPMAADLQQ